MAREKMTAVEVEEEIARLKKSEYVRLAKREYQIREKRQQYLYSLRSLEKKGKALAAAGLSLEMLEQGEDGFDEE